MQKKKKQQERYSWKWLKRTIGNLREILSRGKKKPWTDIPRSIKDTFSGILDYRDQEKVFTDFGPVFSDQKKFGLSVTLGVWCLMGSILKRLSPSKLPGSGLFNSPPIVDPWLESYCTLTYAMRKKLLLFSQCYLNYSRFVVEVRSTLSSL